MNIKNAKLVMLVKEFKPHLPQLQLPLQLINVFLAIQIVLLHLALLDQEPVPIQVLLVLNVKLDGKLIKLQINAHKLLVKLLIAQLAILTIKENAVLAKMDITKMLPTNVLHV